MTASSQFNWRLINWKNDVQIPFNVFSEI